MPVTTITSLPTELIIMIFEFLFAELRIPPLLVYEDVRRIGPSPSGGIWLFHRHETEAYKEWKRYWNISKGLSGAIREAFYHNTTFCFQKPGGPCQFSNEFGGIMRTHIRHIRLEDGTTAHLGDPCLYDLKSHLPVLKEVEIYVPHRVSHRLPNEVREGCSGIDDATADKLRDFLFVSLNKKLTYKFIVESEPMSLTITGERPAEEHD